MAHPGSGTATRQLESLWEGDSVAGLGDRQLLERFIIRRDAGSEVAFAALVTRHGPMVLDICRQIVGDLHHAEDAFQAVFLVLARKAPSLRDADLLSNWLHGVSLRTARNARLRLARQRKYEERGVMRRPGLGSSVPVEATVQPAAEQALAREQAEALHDEIDRLPQSFRLPVVLCYFEGLTLDEAAQRLRWPAGTVGSRLARAHSKLRRGLTRRGMVLSTAALAAALNPKSASARIASHLCDTTTRTAMKFVAGHTGGAVAALAQEVLRSMLVNMLKFTVLALLALGGLVTGAGYLTRSLATAKDEPKSSLVARQATPAAKPERANEQPASGRMFVTGRVLDPQGHPVPSAAVMVYARLKMAERPSMFAFVGPMEISQARCDGSGRFRINAPRTSSSTHNSLDITACASGYGIGLGELDPDAEQPTADVPLRPEQLIQGRVFDVQGQPAGGVKVSIASILLSSIDGTLSGPDSWLPQPKGVAAWPEPATTDGDGRFTLHGVGRKLLVRLIVDDPRFATHNTLIATDGAADTRKIRISPALKLDADSDPKKLTVALRPAQIITGRVTYADNGKPVAHATLELPAMADGSNLETDGEGRYRAKVSGDRVSLTALPLDGQPYLGLSNRFDWPKGAVEQSVDFSLPRGVMVGGKVIEEGSGKPVAGAVVRFTPYQNPNSNPVRMSVPSVTRSDGSFRVAAPPGPGFVVVQGPSDDYVLREMGVNGGAYYAQPGRRRFYAHAYTFLDLKADRASQELNVVLRRGMTVKMRVVGPDDRPVQDATVSSRVIVMAAGPDGGWKIWNSGSRGRVRDGRFELHGLDPDVEVPIHFLDSRHELGATLLLSGKSLANGPVTAFLQLCGTATARLVDPGGRPVPKYRFLPGTAMVVTPGADLKPNSILEKGPLFANEASLAAIDPAHYPIPGPASDFQGQMAFPALIPGASYIFRDFTTVRDPGGPVVRKEFTVKPGETLDLGDILIEKPPG